MIFAIICTDKKDGLEIRKANRPEHLEYLKSIEDALKGAGPFMGTDGNPNGSMLLVEMVDLAAARDFADNDPYAKAGLFANVDIRPWNWLLANPYSDTKGL